MTLRYAPALAGLLACAPLLAHAAGFDCSKAASKVEQTVCANPTLSNYDSQLSRAWRAALKLTRYPSELKADQQAWLEQRNQCADDLSCLRSEYRHRLLLLAPAGISGTFAWEGDWSQPWFPQVHTELHVQALGQGRYRINLSGTSGANAGDYAGEARMDGDELRVDDADGDCQLRLHRTHRQIDIEQTGSCGAGAGVYYSGRYLPGSKAAQGRK